MDIKWEIPNHVIYYKLYSRPSIRELKCEILACQTFLLSWWFYKNRISVSARLNNSSVLDMSHILYVWQLSIHFSLFLSFKKNDHFNIPTKGMIEVPRMMHASSVNNANYSGCSLKCICTLFHWFLSTHKIAYSAKLR